MRITESQLRQLIRREARGLREARASRDPKVAAAAGLLSKMHQTGMSDIFTTFASMNKRKLPKFLGKVYDIIDGAGPEQDKIIAELGLTDDEAQALFALEFPRLEDLPRPLRTGPYLTAAVLAYASAFADDEDLLVRAAKNYGA